MSDESEHKKPNLTVLVQTFKGEIQEQCKKLRSTLSRDLPEVSIIGIELTLGRYNMLVRLSGKEIEALTRANRKISTLKFVQNTAAFITYSEEIVPNEIGDYKVTSDAKQEILQYLGRVQQTIVSDVDGIKEKLENMLMLAKREVKPGEAQITSTEIRLVEKELDRRQEEEKFKRRIRVVAAILGTCLIIPPIVLAIILMASVEFRLTLEISAFMLGLTIMGGILVLMAIDYNRVEAAFNIIIGKK